MSELRQRKGGEASSASSSKDATIDELRAAMKVAAEAEDFDEAKRLKKLIAQAESQGQTSGSAAVSSSATAAQPGDEKKDETEGDKPIDYQQQLEESLQKSLEQVQKLKPGITHETKKHKDALERDPYNLMLMYELGQAYAEESKWEQSLNVMIRGWKRTAELPNPAMRVHWLATLCHASYSCHKYKQAFAVLRDINEDDILENQKQAFEELKCKVLSANEDLQGGLKAFKNAIKGLPFNEAAGVWALCSGDLKKAGGYDATKEMIVALTKTEDDKKKLDALMKLCELRVAVLQESERREKDKFGFSLYKCGRVLLIIALILCILFFLHRLEAKSLEQLKPKPGDTMSDLPEF